MTRNTSTAKTVVPADVKARAREKAAELAEQLRSRAMEAGTQAARTAGPLGDQAVAAGGKAKEKLGAVSDAAPEPVRRAVTTGADRMKRAWVPIAAALTMLFVGRRMARRRKAR